MARLFAKNLHLTGLNDEKMLRDLSLFDDDIARTVVRPSELARSLHVHHGDIRRKQCLQ